MVVKVKIMLTFLPGCGKTTRFKILAVELQGLRPVGLNTEEIRESGVHRGFALRSLGCLKPSWLEFNPLSLGVNPPLPVFC
jgi:nucleoside-triphosphatase THEP1